VQRAERLTLMTDLGDGSPRALVTGVSRGIGRAIAARLLDDGWEVLGTYRSGEDAAHAFAEHYERLAVYRADLALDADVEALLSAVGDRQLGGLVNNAGMIHMEDLAIFDLASWRETLEVNLTAPVRLARALEANLAGGAIVNIASTDGRTGAYSSIAYAVSKAALLNATQSLGNLLARSGIRVNAVSPGWIATDMTSEDEAAISLTPLARVGEVAEVAATVAWLLSSEASFVTGTDIVVDGGYSNVDYVIKLEADRQLRVADERDT
jgi:NAD(P)-dependent dehydrogenase (short-subunit alcohol dehydrogenase family)